MKEFFFITDAASHSAEMSNLVKGDYNQIVIAYEDKGFDEFIKKLDPQGQEVFLYFDVFNDFTYQIIKKCLTKFNRVFFQARNYSTSYSLRDIDCIENFNFKIFGYRPQIDADTITNFKNLFIQIANRNIPLPIFINQDRLYTLKSDLTFETDEGSTQKTLTPSSINVNQESLSDMILDEPLNETDNIAFKQKKVEFSIFRNVNILGNSLSIFQEANFFKPSLYLANDAFLKHRLHNAEHVYLNNFKNTVFIVCGNTGWKNYFHWTLQTILAVKEAVIFVEEKFPEKHLVLLSPSLSKWQERALYFYDLSCLPRLEILDNQIFHIGTLVYCNLQSDLKDVSYNQKSLQVIDKVIQKAKLYLFEKGHISGFGKKLYISRQDTDRREMTNEVELQEYLKSLGYSIFIPGNHSVEEQIMAFNSAQIVIGAHGAGFTNLLYCKKKTKVLEIKPTHYFNNCFVTLCAAKDLRYYQFTHNKIFDKKAKKGSWQIDLNKFKKYLEMVEK